MINVLYVHGGSLNLAGTEAVMMNYYRNISKDEISIDFLVHGNDVGYYDKEIIENGNTIYHAPLMNSIFSYIKYLNSLFSNHHFDIIHVHMNENGALVLFIAKIHKVKVRIVHSHNTNFIKVSFLKKLLRNFEKWLIKFSATNYFSCGLLAAQALYGKKFINRHKIKILNNGIDLNKYIFNNDLREKGRKELNIDNNTVLFGNIGRLSVQKNQKFLLEVINKLLNYDVDYKFILFGDGELEDDLIKMIKQNKLNNIIIKKPIIDIYKWYSAFDYFVLPSLYEGFPVVLVEAQANGLKCFVSDTITEKSNLTNQLDFISLDVDLWVNKLRDSNFILDRENVSKENINILKNKGYDSLMIAKDVENFYLNQCSK